MKTEILGNTIRKKLAGAFLIALFIGICLISNAEDVRAAYQKADESKLPLSTMSVYKNMDDAFLKTFPFGTTYKDTVSVNLETAQQMIEAKDVRLKAGRKVKTSGFYEIGDGGGAVYELSTQKEAGAIALSNGLYANLIVDTTVIDGKTWGIISVKQLGAKGDGQEAEQDQINAAASLAADLVKNKEDVFRSIVYLPEGEYKCTNQVQLNVSDINFVGEGKKSVIFTDNDYRKGIGYYEFFFTMWGAKDLYMADFSVEAREVNGYNYMRQMVFVDCDNVYTYRVDLNIPQEVFTKDYYVDKQYSSLTYYSGNKNMTLDSCKLELMCSTFRGANLGILDFYSRGEENITVMNCELHSDARDEQVGIFSSRQNKEDSFIRNVYFVNNTMYSYQPLDKNAAGGHRNMCFTVAYNDSKNISDVYIKGNHFIADLDSKFMTFGNGIECCVVENNMMEFRCTDNLGAYLFDSSVSDSDRVQIQNNEIFLTYRDVMGTGKAAILGGKATVKGNRILSDTYLSNMGYKDGVYEGNTYINLGVLGSLAKDLTNVCGNKLISYGKLDEIMYFSGSGTDQVVNYTDNTIIDYRRISEKNDVWNHVAKVQGSVKELYFTGNTYLAPNKYYWTWKSVDEPKAADYVKGLFFHNASVGKAVCKSNRFQGANVYAAYGCTIRENYDGELEDGKVNLFASDNEIKDYTLNFADQTCTGIEITKDGIAETEIFTDQDVVTLGTTVKAGHMQEDGTCADETVTNDKELVWYTSLDGIASVDHGVVTRKNYGDVTVYAVAKDGACDENGYAIMGKCKVHFVKGFATGISFKKDRLTLQTTKKYKAVYEVAPLERASQDVMWKSSNAQVATVTSLGVIEAVGVGEADIICETLDGTDISGKIHVTVEELTVKKITLNASSWYDYEYEKNNNWANKGVEIGDTIQLSVTSYIPEAAVNKGIKKWISTNEAVAVVDQNGRVKAVGSGYCEIRAYSMDETCYGTCSVWVQPDEILTKDITVSHTDNYIKLEWKPQDHIHGYMVYCDKADGNGYQRAAKITDPKVTVYEAYSIQYGGGYVEQGKTYKYKIAPYIERWDENGYSHVYETLSDEISVVTYSNSVISKFNTNGVESIGVAPGETANLGVYCSRNTKPSSFRSENEEIFTVKDLAPGSDNYNLEITGVKEGRADLILRGEDELGYEKRIPVLVYKFPKIGNRISAKSLIKSVKITWKVEDETAQDGFQVIYKVNAIQRETFTIPMKDLTLETDENGEVYASYVIGGLENEKSYEAWVAPYKEDDGVIFAGAESSHITATTLAYVNVDSITAEDLQILRVNEEKRITAEVGPEAASEPDLVWIPYHASILEVMESGAVDATHQYTIVQGLKTGITPLSVVADDDNDYQITLKVVVVPEMVMDFKGEADTNSVTLSWNAVDGAASYALYRYDSAQKEWVNIAKTEDTCYVDSDLNANTEYLYKIGACLVDEDGIYEGDQTEAVCIKTQKGKDEDNSDDPGNSDNSGNQGDQDNPDNTGDQGNSGNQGGQGNSENSGTAGGSGNTGDQGNTGTSGGASGSGNQSGAGASGGTGGTSGGTSSSGNQSGADASGGSGTSGNTGNQDGQQNQNTAASGNLNNAFETYTVKNFRITKNATTQVHLSWTVVKDAQGYLIYQYQSKNWKLVATISNGKTDRITLKKLKPGTSYQFRICAYRKANDGKIYTPYSTLKVRTKPSKVKIESITEKNGKIMLCWEKQNADGYEIQYGPSKTFEKNNANQTAGKNRNQITLRSCKPDTVYYVRIRAYVKVNGKKYYGTWSKVKKIMVK